jgi:hypothetical protein
MNRFSFLVGNILFPNACIYLKIAVVYLEMGDIYHLAWVVVDG